MSLSAIPKAMRQRVFVRDQGRCQYCGLAQVGQAAVFHINHILPRSKGGRTEDANLALQCPYCSLHKADKTTATDPISGDVVPLFHPLEQSWDEHLLLDAGGLCHGRTSVGHATVAALKINDMLPRVARAMQIRLRLIAPSSG